MPTLEQIAGMRWPDPGPDATPLVRRCAEYVRTDLAELSDEGLRMLIGQSIHLQQLLPVALRRLEVDPWRSGDMYPGDLLNNVVRCADDPEVREFRQAIRETVTAALSRKIPDFIPLELKSNLATIVQAEK